jgi:hypothetical protein
MASKREASDRAVEGLNRTPCSPEAAAEVARLREHFAREDADMASRGLRGHSLAGILRQSVLEDAAAGKKVAIVSGDVRVYPSFVPETATRDATRSQEAPSTATRPETAA